MLFRTAKSNEYAHGTAGIRSGRQLHLHYSATSRIAFESELVAYRIYFNEKQTTDLYGKFNKGLEIEEVCSILQTNNYKKDSEMT